MKNWDVFICHASEDKNDVVIPLFEHLKNNGLKVWLDKFELTIGDSLREKIDEGLSKSKYGIVILSPDFFKKDWTKNELDGLLQKEIGGNKVILPVWHRIDREEIREYSPILAGRLAGKTEGGIKKLSKDLTMAMTETKPIDASNVKTIPEITTVRLIPEQFQLLSHVVPRVCVVRRR